MDLLNPYQLLVFCFHELLVQNWPKLQPVKDLIHRAQEIYWIAHNCDPFDVSSVFAKGCKECVHGLVNSLSTVGLLFPWVIGTLVYCPVQILRGSASIFTTQGRKYSARNVQDISCIPCRPRHLLGTC